MNRFLFLLASCVFVFGFAAIAAEGGPWSQDWSAKTAVSVIPGGIYLAGTPEKCTADNEGALHYAPEHKALILCDGSKWREVQTAPLGREGAP